jgi:hypothetical protein
MVAMRDSSGMALAVGRFAGWEPLGFEAGDENWYRFVENAPTAKTDAIGLFQVSFEIDTEIKRTHTGVPSFALGVKTRQWATVETDTAAIVKSGNYTNWTAEVIPVLSDFFQDAWTKDSGGDCKVFVTLSGWGQNLANPFLGAINWDFTFEIDIPTRKVAIKSGMHDGFPSYQVFFGPNLYKFNEITPDRLDDPMEIRVP